jgi:hypothetical protein
MFQRAEAVATKNMIETIAPNISILPHHGSLDVVVTFREACEKDVHFIVWVLGPERGVDAWAKMAQDWSGNSP